MSYHLSKHSIWFTVLLLGVTAVGYTLVYAVAFPLLATQSYVLVIFPTALIAWRHGWRFGLLSAFFLFTITFWLFPLINNSWSQPTPLKDFLGVVSIICLLVGLIGHISDSRRRFRQQIAAKEQVEVELRILSNDLQNRVSQRTAELQTSQETYRQLMFNASDAIFIINARGQYLDMNEQAERLIGYSRAELLQMSIQEIATPEELEQQKQTIAAILQGEHSLVERKMRHKDGHIVETEISISLQPDGRLLGIVRDVTRRKAQERALFLSEAYYRSLFENNEIAIVIVNKQGILQSLNSQAAAYLQQPITALIGQPLTDLYDTATSTIYLEQLAHIWQDGFPRQVETTRIQANTPIYFLDNLAPIFDEQQQVTAVQILSQDITPLIQTQAALRESEARWQFALEGSDAGVWDWDDQAGTVYHSKQWKAMLGYTDEELPSAHETWESLVHPEDWPHVQADLQRHFQRETELYTSEYRMRHKDGSYRWIASRGKVFVWNERNQPMRMIGTHTDITEQKKIEDLILYIAQGVSSANGEQFFQSLVQHLATALMPFMAFIGELDPDNERMIRVIAVYKNGRIEQPFFYHLDNTPCDTVIGNQLCIYPESVYEIFPLDKMLVKEHIQGYLGIPLLDSHKKSIGIAAVLYKEPIHQPEIAQSLLQIFATRAGSEIERMRAEKALKQSEEQLRQAQKMEAIGRLAGGVAHDFNNILTVIISYSDLLLRIHNEPSDKDYRRIRQIKESGERAAAITKQLLAFSRRQVMEPTILNLNRIISGMADMLQSLIGENIQMRLQLASNLGQIRADPSQLEQVLLNLVINARDAIGATGEISIETKNVLVNETTSRQFYEMQPGAYVLLAISDNGSGMDEQTLAQIFEPFFTTKERGKGSGLGLAMVHGIIKQSSGHIQVQSTPGQGSTFQVYLPCENAAILPETQTAVNTVSVYGQETILLVEDEEMVREITREILTMHGFTVHVNDGLTAVALCHQLEGKINLLLTDVVMPVMSGHEIATQITASYPHIKVLYMSGYTDNIIVDQGILKQGVSFIAKPFTPDLLAQKVRAVLDDVDSPT